MCHFFCHKAFINDVTLIRKYVHITLGCNRCKKCLTFYNDNIYIDVLTNVKSNK